MTTEGINRKLTAILSADAVGYSRLMAEDEIGTVQRLKSYRELIGVRVREYHGRVVDSPGDNILTEFPSALDAVRSGVEIQRVLKTRNDDLPDNRKMEFRIGIHLGDVMVDGDRIYGDGVNIAARLEGLADPSGICISATVHDQVKTKLDLNYKDMGNQEVKNIKDPVRTYKVLSDPLAVTHQDIETEAKKPWQKITMIIAAAIIIAVGSIFIWDRTYQKDNAPTTVATPAQANTPVEKPSIAVLPFDNISGDPEQEYFSDGMSEEIINGLAKNPGLIVKGRTSSFSEKIRNQDIKTISELLNVTHIVEGSVRKSGNRIRITAQLIDTAEDAHIWSDKYDRELSDVFEIQDEISGEILKALNVHLTGSDEKQFRTSNMEAYDTYLLGYYHYNRHQLIEAEKSFEMAVSLDPNYADAYGALARVYNFYAWQPTSSVKNDLPKIRSCIDKALSLDPNQIDALVIKIWLQFILDHKYQDAIDEMAALLKIYPHNLTLLGFYQDIFVNIDRIDIAFKIANRMVELEPLNPKSYHALGWRFLNLGLYDEAHETFARAEAMGLSIAQGLAVLAFTEGDIQGLQTQLNRDQLAWAASHVYPAYKATASYLRGDLNRVKEILAPLWQTTEYVSYELKSHMAALEGDLDLSLEYYKQAISESEFGAFHGIQAPSFISKIFPDYRSHPKYQKMLKDVGLDEESINKLKIPPLPF